MSQEIEMLFAQINRTFETNMEPIILIDETRKINYFNQAAEKLLDYSRTEILGRGLEVLTEKDTIKELNESITLYFQTGRKGLIDKERHIQLFEKSGESLPVILTMLDILIRGKRNIALFIKNLGEIRNLESERNNIHETLLSKEFDYTTKINILENFIEKSGLKLPDDIEIKSDLLTWTSSYSIELSIIDQQHKKWIEFINMLYRAYKTQAKEKEIAEHISKLLDYTDYHFGFEEKYLEDFKCGNLEKHKKEHAEFVDRIKKHQEMHNNGDTEAAYRLIIYLNSWILNHIQNEDKKYVECFNLNGLS